jgi:stage II sporulation protein AA (anti-sigma F factor antagonist)
VLRLRGELDAANQDLLRCVVRSVLDHHSPRVLVLDLSALGFADCAGLSAVLWTHKHLARQGRELVLAGIQPLVRRLLNVTGLDNVLTRPASVALSRLRGTASWGQEASR